MKKTLAILLSIVMCFSLVACDSSSNSSTSDNTSSDDNVSIVTEETDSNKAETKKEDQDESDDNEFKDISVEITEKVNVPENIDQGRYSDRVEFTFYIENNSDKAVKGIQGVLEVYDLFGEGVLSINADLTGTTIQANDSLSISDIGMDINQFMDEHTKLYNEDYSDLKFTYIVNNVIYSDSTIEQNIITDESSNNSVAVSVTNKYNLSENYDAGRFSPRVQLDFKIDNLTSKDIKGIQGIIAIKDMFGEEIKSFNCDFTGNTISSNGSISITDLGVDVNEFIDEDVKLFNEAYEDLIFEYIVTKIVYADGTIEE